MADRTVEALRAAAAEHGRQLEAVRWCTPADLAGRWGISVAAVRAIPRAALPYILLGETRLRRYRPEDVEHFEAAELAKHDEPQEPAA